MNPLLRVILSLLLVCVGLFCTLGFLATFEPLARAAQLTWRIVYGGVGLACVGGLIRVWRKRVS